MQKLTYLQPKKPPFTVAPEGCSAFRIWCLVWSIKLHIRHPK